MFVGQKATKQSDDEHRVKSLRVEFAGFIEGCRLLILIQPFTLQLVRFPNPLAFGSDFPKSGGDPV